MNGTKVGQRSRSVAIDSRVRPARAGSAAAPRAPLPPRQQDAWVPASPARALAIATAPLVPGVDPLGPVTDLDQAFDTILASSSGQALVRRHSDNVMAWNMKWDLVTKARKTFDFSYFSIERDAYGYAYLGALLDATLRGVKVTGITDYLANSRGHGFSTSGLGADYLQELAAHGATIGLYDPLSTRARRVASEGLGYAALSSDHDKLAVADAGTPQAEGETGGRNVAGAYHQAPEDNPAAWRDDSLQLKGPVTDGLVAAMRRELAGPAVELVKPDLFNLDSHATELLAAYAMMNTWLTAGSLSPAQRTALGLAAGPAAGSPLSPADEALLRQDPAARKRLAQQLLKDSLAALQTLPGIPDSIRARALDPSEILRLEGQAEELCGDLALRGSRERYDALGGYSPAEVKIIDQVGAASAPEGQRYNEMAPSLLHLLRGAQKEIVIENPYVVLTEPMVQELERASRRGVQITIVTNSPASTDSALTQGFFLDDWKTLEARVPTARLFVATGQRKLHAKTFVLDGKVSGDTSYNADLLSAMIDGEVGAITRSEASAQHLLGSIRDDLADPANGFKEWTIQRDAKGQALRDARGQYLAAEGPEQDVSPKLQRLYGPVRLLCELLTRTGLGRPLHLDEP